MSETTTTTTTLPYRTPSLKHVVTVSVTKNGEFEITDSSDDKGTLKTINSGAMSFGIISPGEISETLIVYLKVTSSQAISDIRLALTDCGNLTFGETKFGVETYGFLDYNIVPENEFSGVNSSDDPNSSYNISIANKDFYTSQYAYLNMTIPNGQLLDTGVIRYKWYFDFA